MECMHKKTISEIIRAIIVCLMVGIFILPFIYILFTSFKPIAETHQVPPTLWPDTWTTIGYKEVFLKNPFGPQYFVNSIIVTLGTVAFVIVCASFGAYGFARLRIPGKLYIMLFILGSYMFPGPVIMVPIYETFKQLGLIDSRLGLIILYTVFSLPFCIWMLTGYFGGIPEELCDAARIDGCSEIGILTKIMVPVARPGLVATALFSFLVSWNEFLFAFILLKSQEKYTITLGLVNFITRYHVLWNEMSAMAVVAIAPVVVFFLFLSGSFVKGLTAGAIK